MQRCILELVLCVETQRRTRTASLFVFFLFCLPLFLYAAHSLRRAYPQELPLLAGNAGSSDELGVGPSQRVASKSLEGIGGQGRGVAFSWPVMS